MKQYLPLAFLSIIFVLLLVFLNNRNSLNFVEEQKQLIPTTVPTPTVVQTQTYRNEKYGFEFEYLSPYLTVEETPLTYLQIIKNYNSSKYPKTCTKDNTSDNGFCEIFNIVLEKDYLIGNVKLHYFVHGANDGNTSEIYFTYKNKNYLINVGPDMDQSVPEILSTFKFTK